MKVTMVGVHAGPLPAEEVMVCKVCHGASICQARGFEERSGRYALKKT